MAEGDGSHRREAMPRPQGPAPMTMTSWMMGKLSSDMVRVVVKASEMGEVRCVWRYHLFAWEFWSRINIVLASSEANPDGQVARERAFSELLHLWATEFGKDRGVPLRLEGALSMRARCRDQTP